MKAKAETETHQLTVAAIGKMVADFNRRRHAVTLELAALFAASVDQAQELPPTPRAGEIRTRTLELINGAAPDRLKLPPVKPRREVLEVELAALDEVLTVLSQREVIARGAEAELY